VIDETTGLLAEGMEGLVDAFKRLLGDESLRNRLGRAAEEYARSLTWDATASSTLRVLLGEATGRA
jgi:glycosyltransferase involved in cell wall biosynthesis